MEEKRVFEGKTTNEAIENGLKELKLNKKDVEIRVIEEEDKRSFFSILTPRVVKVEITPKNNIEKREEKKEEKIKEEIIIEKKELEKVKENIKKFLDEFFGKTENNIKYEIKDDEKNTIIIDVTGTDANYLIGYRGEVLNAFQTYLISIAGKFSKEKIHVNIDVLGYREKRKKVLEDLATRVANNVVRGRKSITLDPMTAYERKIIHTKLQENSKVKTMSIGEGNHRRIVISLK